MKLGDILPYISQAEDVRIWLNGEVVSHYNGKDSIPAEHNALHVEEGGICAYAHVNKASIDIYCYEE